MEERMETIICERIDGLLTNFDAFVELKDLTKQLVLRLNQLKQEIRIMKAEKNELLSEGQTNELELQSLKSEIMSLHEEKEMMRKELREVRHQNDLLEDKLKKSDSQTLQAIEFVKTVLQNNNLNPISIVNSLPAFSEQMVLNDRPNRSLTEFSSTAQLINDGMRLTSTQSSSRDDKTESPYHSTRMPSIQTSKESSDDTYYDAPSNRSSITNGCNGIPFKECQQNQISSTVPSEPKVDKLNESMVITTDSSNSFDLDANNNLKLKRLKVLIGRLVSVSISYINSPSSFWLHIDSHLVYNYVHAIQVKQEELIKTPGSKLTPADIQRGMYCAAIYSADREWYRAQIIRINYENCVEKDSIRTVKVLFIDWGNCEDVPLSKVMKLSPELTKQRQAVHCCLQGIDNGKWSKESIDKFKEMVDNRQLSASFHKEVKLDERIDSVIYPTDLFIICENGLTENLVNHLPIPEDCEEVLIDRDLNDLKGEPTDPKSMTTSTTLVCNGELNDNSNKSLGTTASKTMAKPNSTAMKTQSNHNCAIDSMPKVTESVPKSMPQLNIVSDTLKIPAPLLPDKSKGLIAEPSHLINPSHFYLHINDTQVGSAQFDDLETKLNQYYPEFIPSRPTQVHEVSVGSFWSCKFSADDQWYRVRVIKVEVLKVYVNYVDYGNEEWTDISNLRSLTRPFANCPAIGVKCCLSKVSGNGPDNKWSQKAANHFDNLFSDRPLTVDIVERPEPFDFDSTLEVFLWTNDSNGKDIDINFDLIKQNYAKSDCSEWLRGAQKAQREKTPPEVNGKQLIPKILNSNYSPVNGLTNGHSTAMPGPNTNNGFKILHQLVDEYSEDDDEWDPMAEDTNDVLNNYNIPINDPGFATIGFRPENRKICKYFGTRKGCRLNDLCSFKHDDPQQRFAFDDKEDEPLEFADMELDVDSCVVFKVTSILSPFSFFGVLPFGKQSLIESINGDHELEAEYQNLQLMSDTLRERYSKVSKTKENPNVFPGIGTLVAYRGETTDMYYRGRVIRADSDETECTVFNIDLGSDAIVQRSRVFKLDPYFCQLPPLAIQCSLIGIEPIDNEEGQSVWSDLAINTFGKWTLGKELMAQIIQTDGKIYIELIDREGDKNVFISDKLVEYNFGKRVQKELFGK